MERRQIIPVHADNRGYIADILYNHPVDHVAIVDTVARSIRGNHYHKASTQHLLVTKGSLEYWHKPLNSEEPAKFVVLREYDFVSTPPGRDTRYANAGGQPVHRIQRGAARRHGL